MSTGRDFPADPRSGREIQPQAAPGGFPLAGSPIVAPSGPAPNELLGLVRAFRRRWPLAIGLGLLVAMVAAAVAWKVVPPAKYTATAQLKMSSVRPAILYSRSHEEDADFKVYQQTQVGLIRSRTVLEEALKSEGVVNLPIVLEQDDPYEWLLEELKIDVKPQNENVVLSLSSDRPQHASAILEAVVRAYMQYYGNSEKEERAKKLTELERLYVLYKDGLKKSREDLREQSKQAGATDRETFALMTGYAHENAAKANALKMEVAKQIMEDEAEIKVLEARLRSAPPSAPAPVLDPRMKSSAISQPAFENDAQVIHLREEVAKWDAELQKVRGMARRSRDPAAKKFLDSKLAAQANLDTRLAALAASGVGTGHVPQVPGAPPEDPVAERLAAVKDDVRQKRLIEAQMIAQVNLFRDEAQQHNKNAQSVLEQVEQVALDDSLVKLVGTQIQQLKVEVQAPNRVDVIDWPKPPKTKDELKKVKIVGMLTLATFGLVALGITFLEHRARRIGSVAQVEQSLGLKLVGALPSPNKTGRALARRGGTVLNAAQARSRLIESIDATRTMLLHASRTESIRVVMITSAVKGEGKTSLSSHLATSLARAGRRTLLVDCDLRRPALHRLFDLPQGPGMCELLRGEVDLASVVHRAPAGELDVVPSGRCDPAALQMLARDQARRIFDAMAAEYDFVIVDTSPVLPVADALLLGQQVDAVIFSILHEVSCVPQVQLAHDKLASLGVRVMGAVVNGAAGSHYGYDGYQVYDRAGAEA